MSIIFRLCIGIFSVGIWGCSNTPHSVVKGTSVNNGPYEPPTYSCSSEPNAIAINVTESRQELLLTKDGKTEVLRIQSVEPNDLVIVPKIICEQEKPVFPLNGSVTKVRMEISGKRLKVLLNLRDESTKELQYKIGSNVARVEAKDN